MCVIISTAVELKNKRGGVFMAASETSRILQAAIRLLGERGHSVTAKDIARRAKVPEGAIYRIFGSKRNLFDCADEARMAASSDPACVPAFQADSSCLFSRGRRLSRIKYFTVENNIQVCYMNALGRLR
jgi:AcrR family transcriptional regulator